MSEFTEALKKQKKSREEGVALDDVVTRGRFKGQTYRTMILESEGNYVYWFCKECGVTLNNEAFAFFQRTGKAEIE